MNIIINFILAYIVASLFAGEFTFQELFWLNFTVSTLSDFYRHFGISYTSKHKGSEVTINVDKENKDE